MGYLLVGVIVGGLAGLLAFFCGFGGVTGALIYCVIGIVTVAALLALWS
jgi:hypothetical protein